jgi:GT2 family glycosyltransferase
VKASASSIRPGFTLVRRELTSRPKISIIIPTRGDMKRVWGVTTCIVSNAVNSILTLSTYDNYEVIVMRDVPPTGGEPASWGFVNDPRVRVIDYPFPFNFADKCNVGVLYAEGDVIILLNDDTQVISPDWLESLTALLEDDSVGMVGPMLLLEDGRIQSAGHINDPTPRHLGAGDRGNAPGKFGAYLVTRCVSGVTGACVAMRKTTYMAVGGMSLDYPVSFNDVDLGNKVLESDLKILWTPLARLYHFESLTRDKTVTQEEGLALERRWKRFYNNEVYSR